MSAPAASTPPPPPPPITSPTNSSNTQIVVAITRTLRDAEIQSLKTHFPRILLDVATYSLTHNPQALVDLHQQFDCIVVDLRDNMQQLWLQVVLPAATKQLNHMLVVLKNKCWTWSNRYASTLMHAAGVVTTSLPVDSPNKKTFVKQLSNSKISTAAQKPWYRRLF